MNEPRGTVLATAQVRDAGRCYHACQAMIEFVSLLLGLTVGHQTVRVAVEGPVAAVEMRLDGTAVGTITQEPWYLRIDFGQRLEPRLLEAIAVDGEGRELAAASQVINYARANYEAVLILGPETRDSPRGGRVIWEAILDRRPGDIDLVFDERSVPVTKEGRFELPAYDPGATHFLTATLRFPGRESAQADLSFGGAYGERVTSALTALPVLLPPGQELPAVDRLQDWFRKGDEPLRVFATPKDDARLMVIRDPNVDDELRQAARELRRRKLMPRSPVVRPRDAVLFVPTTPLRAHRGAFHAVEVRQRKVESGLWELISKLYPRMEESGRQQPWTALAAAGRGAVDGDRRRAVVMLLGSRVRDGGKIRPAQAIGYLRSVRVPHFVWAPRRDALPFEDSAGASFASASFYGGADGLAALFEDLEESLGSQRMVWLEGLHFPGQVSLTDRVPEGVRLAE